MAYLERDCGVGPLEKSTKGKIEIAIKIIFALMLIHAFSYDLDWIEIVRAVPYRLYVGSCRRLIMSYYYYLISITIMDSLGVFVVDPLNSKIQIIETNHFSVPFLELCNYQSNR